MVPGKPTLQRTTAVDDAIMAQPNTNHDNDDADARQPNDTPERMQRNDTSTDETAITLVTSNPTHSRACDQEKREIKDRRNKSYVTEVKTELTQYIAKPPEIPAEVALSRDDRKQLAEIMPEYPPRNQP